MATLAAKPLLRGVSHQYAFFVAVAAGAVLVVRAPTGQARVACLVYVLSLCAMLGASALYHRIDWPPTRSLWMRRLDHAMIYVLIAGTITPFALVLVHGPLRPVILAVAWGGALVGILLALRWIDAPRWLAAGLYLALGWVSLAIAPQILDRVGPGAIALLLAGGALYSAGAVVYGRRRPDPRPAVFGFHEVFHLFVLAAAATHYVAVTLYVR